MTELEKYQRMAELLNMQGEKPNEEQIQETISIIKERLLYKPINRHVNAAVKEGYMKAVEILENKETDFNKVDVSELKTVQGRTIASLGSDYLNGLCTAVALCGVPIKDK